MSPKPTYEEVEQRVEQLKKDLTRKGKELEDLRRFVDRSQDVIYRYNIDANLFILYNKAGYELYGAKDGTGLTVKTVLLSIHPEDRDKVKKAAKDSLSPNRSKGEVEYRQQHLDGSIRWMHDKWLVMRGESGKPLFIEGIVRDNTERRQVEEELRKSEQEFRVVAENVPALFSYVDANGYYRFVNNRYEKWFGISRKHIVGKHIREVLGEDTYELIKARIETVLSGNRVKYEDVLPYKRGGKRYVTVDYVPDIDERGEVRGFYALVTDISERKLTEQALQKSEERYRSLVESTEDSIYLVDRNCNYLFMNKKHLSSFGLSMNEILGRNYSDFHSEEATKDFIGKIERAIASGESISYEYKSERDGRDFILTMSPVRETAGNINAVTVISKDITERRQAEEALRRSNEKLLKEHNQRKILSNKLIELLEKDRHEIAMELHDHIGQTLTSLKMNLEIIREQIKPTDTELESQISDAEKKAIQALKDIRSVYHGGP